MLPFKHIGNATNLNMASTEATLKRARREGGATAGGDATVGEKRQQHHQPSPLAAAAAAAQKLVQQVVVVYRGTFMHTPSWGQLQVLEDALLGVDAAGVIQIVEEHTSTKHGLLVQLSKAAGKLRVLDSNEVLLPGLVDCHVHAPQWPLVGKGLHLPLDKWLQVCASRANPAPSHLTTVAGALFAGNRSMHSQQSERVATWATLAPSTLP